MSVVSIPEHLTAAMRYPPQAVLDDAALIEVTAPPRDELHSDPVGLGPNVRRSGRRECFGAIAEEHVRQTRPSRSFTSSKMGISTSTPLVRPIPRRSR